MPLASMASFNLYVMKFLAQVHLAKAKLSCYLQMKSVALYGLGYGELQINLL
eukprot:c41828_g1_i1 orf=66-221(-)